MRPSHGRAVLAALLGLVVAGTTSGCFPPALSGSSDTGSAPTRGTAPTSGARASSGLRTGSAPGTSPAPGSSQRPAASLVEQVPATFPRSGPGTFRYGSTGGPVLGRGGALVRFRVAVESNLIMIDVPTFAVALDQVLGDSHSWIASGRLRLQRVPGTASAGFTIYLSTSSTSTTMCAAGGAGRTMGYTSCRYSGHVVLNLDRWLTSVPYYTKAGIPLSTYRTYMVNHEVGHQLGHGHELCPRQGRPAPVMQQQTLGLHGCVPNAWPYLNGSLYAGPPGSY